MFDYLSANCGENISNLLAAEYVFDSLRIEQLNHLVVPDWVNEQLLARLRHISDLTFYIEYMTRQAQRLRTGTHNPMMQFKEIRM